MKMLENEKLAKHTTFHLGGSARYFCEVKNIDELKEALDFAKEKNIPYFILGGGSNIIVNDNRYSGVVIKCQMSNVKCQKLGAPSAQHYIFDCEAGVSLATVVKKSIDEKLVGMEWAWGIPGTVGGAVRGNAGAYGGEMKGSVESVTVLRDGKIVELKNNNCRFGYRESIFKKNGDIIWNVKLKLEKRSEDDIKKGKELVEKIKKERGDKFKGGYNAGSFFKNIELKEKEIREIKKNKRLTKSLGNTRDKIGLNLLNKEAILEIPEQFIAKKMIPAAWLIDQCGLKGFCVGDICVSEKHAGIILNKGKGTSDELFQLVGIIKMKVRNKFGLNLKEEIQYL